MLCVSLKTNSFGFELKASIFEDSLKTEIFKGKRALKLIKALVDVMDIQIVKEICNFEQICSYYCCAIKKFALQPFMN